MLIEFMTLDGEAIVVNPNEIVCFGERGQGTELATGDGYLTVVVEGSPEEVREQLGLEVVTFEGLDTRTEEKIGLVHIVPTKVILIREPAEGSIEVRLGAGGFYVEVVGEFSEVVANLT